MEVKFQEALNTYLCDVKRVRGKLLTHRRSQSRHYRWAVERVCLGWTWDHIADQDEDPKGVSSQAVRQAVSPILYSIGIPRKPTELDLAVLSSGWTSQF